MPSPIIFSIVGLGPPPLGVRHRLEGHGVDVYGQRVRPHAYRVVEGVGVADGLIQLHEASVPDAPFQRRPRVGERVPDLQRPVVDDDETRRLAGVAGPQVVPAFDRADRAAGPTPGSDVLRLCAVLPEGLDVSGGKRRAVLVDDVVPYLYGVYQSVFALAPGCGDVRLRIAVFADLNEGPVYPWAVTLRHDPAAILPDGPAAAFVNGLVSVQILLGMQLRPGRNKRLGVLAQGRRRGRRRRRGNCRRLREPVSAGPRLSSAAGPVSVLPPLPHTPPRLRA